jgi:hypothetical protein
LIAFISVSDFQDWIYNFEMNGSMHACVQWKLCALLAFFGAFLKAVLLL